MVNRFCAALLLTVVSAASVSAPGVSPESSTPREVRVFFWGTYTFGDSVPLRALAVVLFLKEPCPLEIVGAEHMRRAWMNMAAYQLGCWYPTMSDSYVYIDGRGDLHAGGAYWESLPRAVVNSDGSVTITEPGFDTIDKFSSRVNNAKTMERINGVQTPKP